MTTTLSGTFEHEDGGAGAPEHADAAAGKNENGKWGSPIDSAPFKEG